jgi:hypothetical protein
VKSPHGDGNAQRDLDEERLSQGFTTDKVRSLSEEELARWQCGRVPAAWLCGGAQVALGMAGCGDARDSSAVVRRRHAGARRRRVGQQARAQDSVAARGSEHETVRRRGAASVGRCGGAGQLRRRRKRGGAGGFGEKRGGSGGLRRWIEIDDETRSERTVKKAEIRFSRDDRTRWSYDRTRWSSVRSESSKLLA